jgi:hypothetical protein
MKKKPVPGFEMLFWVVGTEDSMGVRRHYVTHSAGEGIWWDGTLTLQFREDESLYHLMDSASTQLLTDTVG